MSKGGGFSSLEDSAGRPLKQNLKGNGKFILRQVSFGKYCWQFFFHYVLIKPRREMSLSGKTLHERAV